jgi:hypothetical protein
LCQEIVRDVNVFQIERISQQLQIEHCQQVVMQDQLVQVEKVQEGVRVDQRNASRFDVYFAITLFESPRFEHGSCELIYAN